MAGRGGAARPNGPAAGNKICQFKLVLLGESAVGKSSLVLRFVKGQFHEYQESTIGGECQLQIPLARRCWPHQCSPGLLEALMAISIQFGFFAVNSQAANALTLGFQLVCWCEDQHSRE